MIIATSCITLSPNLGSVISSLTANLRSVQQREISFDDINDVDP